MVQEYDRKAKKGVKNHLFKKVTCKKKKYIYIKYINYYINNKGAKTIDSFY